MALRFEVDSVEQHLQPVAGARDVVAQERRRLVHVHHQDVDVAVVVEVAEGTAAARVRRGHACFPLPR